MLLNKKILLAFILLLNVFKVFAEPIVIKQITIDGVTYTLYRDGDQRYASVTNFVHDNKKRELVLQSQLSNLFITYPVTSINAKVFYNSPELTKIKLPGYGVTIGAKAFGDCKYLKEVTFQSAPSQIPDSAFVGCVSLEVVKIPRSSSDDFNLKRIGNSAFDGCSNLKVITELSSLETIGKHAFQDCFMLQIMALPSTIREIGEYAFARTGITEMKFMNSKTALQMGPDVFYGCSKLKTVDMLNVDLKRLPLATFSRCLALEDIKLPQSLTEIATFAFDDCKALQTINLPSTLQKIGESTFSDCEFLGSIILPYQVNSIGESAFSNCIRLKTVQICSNIALIPKKAFVGCTSLQTVSFGGNVGCIDENAFRNCFQLSTLYVTQSITTICKGAFYQTAISSFSFPSLQLLGDEAFANCNQLKEVKIPKDLKHIANKAFYNCQNLTTVELNEGVESIGNNVFQLCSKLENVNLPTTLYHIGTQAFSDCIKLTQIILPDNLFSIGEFCFEKTSLRSLTVPPKVESIPCGIISDCSALQEVNIPTRENDEILEIKENAFGNCKSLLQVKLPTQIYIQNDTHNTYKHIFDGCDNLQLICLTGEVLPTWDLNAGFDVLIPSSGPNKNIYENIILQINNIWTKGSLGKPWCNFKHIVGDKPEMVSCKNDLSDVPSESTDFTVESKMPYVVIQHNNHLFKKVNKCK